MSRLKSFLIFVGLLCSVSAVAHPGHGTFTGHEVWHYLTSPVHIGVALTAVIVVIGVYRLYGVVNKSKSDK
jgi:hypothetical protein